MYYMYMYVYISLSLYMYIYIYIYYFPCIGYKAFSPKGKTPRENRVARIGI